MTPTIKHQLSFTQPPEAVWGFITQQELLELWLMRNDFKPIVGYEFTFRTSPKPERNFDGVMHCKVLEITPFKTLSYTWACGPGDGSFTIESVVSWRLEAKGTGTTLYLEHAATQKTSDLAHFNMFDAGWEMLLPRIAKLLNDRENGHTNA